MDSDSDSPFNYSWPSFPKMKMRKKTGKKVPPSLELTSLDLSVGAQKRKHDGGGERVRLGPQV
ncbi:hypothetical protein EYF80_066548 [Liparis tanakae]|uniref:Uncharacterized protein n=1 Tax=Liparis tanakae TaxID=230148 RepID=A0A4Z2E3Q7_9TELE|nr:hypothetical protein EYF80_066548 [Liparis tanakae]